MRKTIYFCDRCGQEMHGIVLQIGVRNIDKDTGFETERNWGAELCDGCYQELKEMTNWLMENKSVHFSEGMRAPEPDPEEAPEPEKKRHPKAERIHEARVRGGQKRKLDLDLGKIAALYNAGWSKKKIADEMHCSDVTIGNRLDEALEFLRKKQEREESNGSDETE